MVWTLVAAGASRTGTGRRGFGTGSDADGKSGLPGQHGGQRLERVKGGDPPSGPAACRGAFGNPECDLGFRSHPARKDLADVLQVGIFQLVLDEYSGVVS